MRVEVTENFQWAPDGNNVRTVSVGEVLEGRGAEVALELKKGKLIAASHPPVAPPQPSPAAPPPPVAAVTPPSHPPIAHASTDTLKAKRKAK